MKKKILSVIMSAMVLSLVGCGAKSGKSVSDLDPMDYVELGQYEGIQVDLAGQYNVDEETINDFIESQLKEMSTYEKDDSQTKVLSDSIVNVDYVGLLDGEEFAGGAAQNVEIDVAGNCSTNGSSYIPGFTAGLAGAEVGATVDSPVTFPENYPAADLAGKDVIFRFTINYICKKGQEPVLSDEYVKEKFGYNTVDEYKDYVKTYLEQSNKASESTAIRKQIVESVQANCNVKDIPEAVITDRVDSYIAQYKDSYAKDYDSIEDYLAEQGVDFDDFNKEIYDSVSADISQELIFLAVAKDAGIEFDEKGYSEYLSNIMARYNFNDEKDLYEAYSSKNEKGEDYIKRVYTCNKAIDYCLEKGLIIY